MRGAISRMQRRFPGVTGELVRFAVVGASGYIVNLAVYALLLDAGVDYLPAAVGAFTVAVVNNYSWNRLWTFRIAAASGTASEQGARFLVVSLGSLCANLALLHTFVALHTDRLLAQATAILLVTPLNFLGSKMWAFARPKHVTAA